MITTSEMMRKTMTRFSMKITCRKGAGTLPRPLPYRIDSAGMEGMAFQQTAPRHHQSPEHTVSLDGILRIDGACGMKPAGRPQQRRQADTIGHQQGDAQPPYGEGSPKRASRCLCNMPRHWLCNSAKGRIRQSRFGNTRNMFPGTNAVRTERPNSRNRRLARFRRTAVPKRRPITIPNIASPDVPGQIWRLNNPVETR